MTRRSEDRVLGLPDGRRLGFAEYGAPDGRPLLFFHGTPGARLVARFADANAARRGIRIIAPDRPGYGLSDFQPGRRIGQWPDDVAALADALDLDRFAVVGVSGGAPYAAACAWRLADRVRVAGIVSGVGPLDDPSLIADLSAGHRLSFALMRRAPWLTRGALALVALAVRRCPMRALDLVAQLGPVADRQILARPEIRVALARDLVEALRAGGRGAAHELGLFGRPWGFRPDDIRVLVQLWHGEADAQVPVAVGRHLARRIPNCKAHFLAGAGHLWLFDHCDEVLAGLTAA